MSTKLFSTYCRDGALVVAPLEPIGSLNAAEVRTEAEGLMAEVHAQGLTKVIFEMSRADYFGSQVIELMILVWRYLAPARGTIVLCCLSPAAKDMMHVVGLNTLWPICNTLDEAVAVPAQRAEV
jgi:anti-sigma B factor antagonist